MRVVAFQSEVLKNKILKLRAGWIKNHARQGAAFAGELQAGLVEVVGIEMKVAEGVNKRSGLETADLSDHEREERVGGDIKRDSKKKIGAALIELAAEFAILNIKLEKRVAGREGH